MKIWLDWKGNIFISDFDLLRLNHFGRNEQPSEFVLS